MNTTEILEKTKKLVSESRHDTHGDKVIKHENISRLWTAYLQNKFKLNLVLLPEDVACLMSLLKFEYRNYSLPNFQLLFLFGHLQYKLAMQV